MAGLSPKRALFVEEYLVDLNGTQAAIRAGYKESTAAVQASQMLADDAVKAAIAEGMKTRADRLGLDAYWVLNRLKDISDRCMQAEPVLDREGMPTGEYRFEASGANKATELIGKHLGMFKEKVEHSGPNGGPMQVEVNDAKQRLAERLSRLKPRPDPGGAG